MRQAVREARERHPDQPVRVLDFGCGKNLALADLVEEVADVEATGISAGDIRTPEERAEQERRGIRFKDVTESREELPNDYYDLIVSQTTFRHLYDPLAELRKLYRALRRGGELRVGWPFRYIAEKFQQAHENLTTAEADALRFLDVLRASGIDSQYDRQNAVLTIRKNETPMKFPSIRYRTPDEKGHGLYELV